MSSSCLPNSTGTALLLLLIFLPRPHPLQVPLFLRSPRKLATALASPGHDFKLPRCWTAGNDPWPRLHSSVLGMTLNCLGVEQPEVIRGFPAQPAPLIPVNQDHHQSTMATPALAICSHGKQVSFDSLHILSQPPDNLSTPPAHRVVPGTSLFDNFRDTCATALDPGQYKTQSPGESIPALN